TRASPGSPTKTPSTTRSPAASSATPSACCARCSSVDSPMSSKPLWKRKRLLLTLLLVAWAVAPESPQIPVAGAGPGDWNRATFWFEPWGRSGVHKGIDIFAAKGAPVVAPTYGLVVFRGEVPLGGRVVAMLGPKWRIHYFAHLQDFDAFPGMPVVAGSRLGGVGDSGNAKGKPAHLHYSVISLL